MSPFKTLTVLSFMLIWQLTRQGRFSSNVAMYQECDSFDVVFEYITSSAIVCATVCNTHQMCLGMFYNQNTQICTGCSGLYADSISTGGSMVQNDTKYYYSCANDFGWNTFEGTSYKLVFSYLYYAEAKKYCHALCSHLVHTDTAKEMQYLRLIAVNADVFGVYLGLEYNPSTYEWRWGDDGSIVNLTFWHIGEPNHPHDEHCVAILKHSDYNWADVTCFATDYFFVCEKELN